LGVSGNLVLNGVTALTGASAAPSCPSKQPHRYAAEGSYMQMNENLIIRNAKISDAVALAKLAGELGYPTTTAEMKSRIDELLSKSFHGLFVAELDSVVGWIHVSLIQSLESDSFAEILGLVVAESHRGSGIGAQLVATAECWAEKKGCHRIRARTNIVREKTRTFYRRLGFQSKKTQEVFDKTF
jgi:GNAT superfamily N-acetyltransferase